MLRASQGFQVIPIYSQGGNHCLHREMAIQGESSLLAFKELVHFIWVTEFMGTELFNLLKSLILLLKSRASVVTTLSFLVQVISFFLHWLAWLAIYEFYWPFQIALLFFLFDFFQRAAFWFCWFSLFSHF